MRDNPKYNELFCAESYVNPLASFRGIRTTGLAWRRPLGAIQTNGKSIKKCRHDVVLQDAPFHEKKKKKTVQCRTSVGGAILIARQKQVPNSFCFLTVVAGTTHASNEKRVRRYFLESSTHRQHSSRRVQPIPGMLLLFLLYQVPGTWYTGMGTIHTHASGDKRF